MFTVWTTDDLCCDDVMMFEGSLAECIEYVENDDFGDLYIVEPDGFTVYEL